MESQITKKYYREIEKKSLNQCDILQHLYIPSATDYDLKNKEYSITEDYLQFAIIINQDCDLDRDYKDRFDSKAANQDKVLPNIIILPAYLSEEFKTGGHRGDIKGNKWSSDQYKQIKKNGNVRFHFIEKNEDLQIPDLIIDFKHIYSLNTDILYKIINDVYYASVCELFRESISNRFAYYLGRIGLPEIN